MKPHRGRRGTAPLILNLGTDGGQWSTSRLGRSTPVLTEEEAGCAPQPVSKFCGRDNLLHLPEFEPRTFKPVDCRYTAK